MTTTQHKHHEQHEPDITGAIHKVAAAIREWDRVAEANRHGPNQQTGGGSVMLMTAMNTTAAVLTAMEAAVHAIRQMPEFRP